MLLAREKRSQEALLELKTQRDAVRRGAASLSRKIKVTEEVAERSRELAVADNATLLGECNRLKRELESSKAEVRRLRLDMRRAASAAAKVSASAAGPGTTTAPERSRAGSESKNSLPEAVASGSATKAAVAVGARRGRRLDALGSRRTAALPSGGSMPDLPKPGRAHRGAGGTLSQSGRAAMGGGLASYAGASGADAVAGSQLPGRTIEAMEAQIVHARREAEETASRAVGLVAAVGRR
jgi:hypothetical protein